MPWPRPWATFAASVAAIPGRAATAPSTPSPHAHRPARKHARTTLRQRPQPPRSRLRRSTTGWSCPPRSPHTRRIANRELAGQERRGILALVQSVLGHVCKLLTCDYPFRDLSYMCNAAGHRHGGQVPLGHSLTYIPGPRMRSNLLLKMIRRCRRGCQEELSVSGRNHRERTAIRALKRPGGFKKDVRIAEGTLPQ